MSKVHNNRILKERRMELRRRDKFFKELGYKTVRFLNREVEDDVEKVLEKIKIFLL